MTADNFPGVCIHCQPDPLFIAFVIHKRPQFIHLYRQFTLALGDD